MKRIKLNITVLLPDLLYNIMRNLKHRYCPSQIYPTINLSGDRDVEYSFCASEMPKGPGKAIDFGNGGSYMGLIAASRGFEVLALDLQQVRWPYEHPKLKFTQGDLLNLSLSDNQYDLVINCSTVEHVGVSGRYGVKQCLVDGDLKAMSRLRGLMKLSGIMLLTIPVGQDAVFKPLHRIYGAKRLPLLLQGFEVLKENFWIKNEKNCWINCTKDTALNFKASTNSIYSLDNLYALGCFVLKCT